MRDHGIAQVLDHLDRGGQALLRRAQRDVVGAHAQRHRATSRRTGLRHAHAGPRQALARAGRHGGHGEEVHRGRAEEAGDEAARRLLEQRQRRADLLDAARVEERDAIAQRHGLDLVMGHVDHGRAQLAMQARQLQAHLHAQGRIEVGQRLVEQEDRGPAHDGAADGHALALAAGELARPALQQRTDLQDLRDLADALAHLGAGQPGHLQREAHVLLDGHVRVQRIALEHHRHAALRRIERGHAAPADADIAVVDVLEPRDHAQQRRLAAAGRADEHGELAIGDVQVDALEHLDAAAVALAQAAQLHVSHGRAPAPARPRGGAPRRSWRCTSARCP